MKRIASKSKQIEIEIADGVKKTFTVYEVRPFDVKQILDSVTKETTLESLIEQALTLCTSLTFEDLKDLFPSDLEKLYEAFKLVNSPLWKFSGFWKIPEILKTTLIKTIGLPAFQAMQKELTDKFANLSATAT